MQTEKSPNQPSKSSSPQERLVQILDTGTKGEVRALFGFDREDYESEVLFKFNLWGRHFHPKFYKAPDAPFHREIDLRLLRLYHGDLLSFLNIAFRGAAKTTRTKLFVAFVIANDLEHYRRYFKILSADYGNAKQNVTDVYNLLITPRVHYYYPEIFQKTTEKREETMASFTTSTGVRMQADSVGMDQRGDIQEDARPDFLWFDDFETRKTLRSAVTTQAIWGNMDEAKNGLSREGVALYNSNYLSERGNVHRLVSKLPPEQKLITPIKGSIVNGEWKDGPPTWPAAYTPELVATKLDNADDPAGDYLCVPSAGPDILFDREALSRQKVKTPIREIAGFKMFHPYDASHRYGSGHDVAGGVGLDSSTSVFIDFSTIPSRVVATFKSNTIKPDTFGDEIRSEADRFGTPIVAVENNKFDMCIGRLKQIYEHLYFTELKDSKLPAAGSVSRSRTYGWNTNADTKPKMLFALKKAVEDGLLELSDPDIIAELRSYTRDDLMEKDVDPRLTTRHFDLLMACAVAYMMKDHAEIARVEKPGGYQQAPYEPPTL
jgi:hypothetical protein